MAAEDAKFEPAAKVVEGEEGIPRDPPRRDKEKKKLEHTLDVPARPHILRAVQVKGSGVAVLEGSDVARIEEQLKNIAHNLLPILNHNLYPERF